VAAGDNVGLHARLRAQNAGHVLGLPAGERCGGFIPMLSNPTSAGHPFTPCVFSLYPCGKKYPPKNTSGERWMRSPEVLPFGWKYRYFFFAAFFAAFFAGAFLAAFLVAICLFSLLRILFRRCNIFAVDECIDLSSASVKKKTT